MRRFQIDRRGDVVLECVFPARDANTPAIARFETREPPFWMWGDQIISIEHGKIQKFAGCLHADRVQSDILGTGATKSVAIKSGHRIATTRAELGAKNVSRHQSILR